MKDVAVEIGIAIVTGLGLWAFTSGVDGAKHEKTQGLLGNLQELQADVVQSLEGEATTLKSLDSAVKESASMMHAITTGQGDMLELATAQTETLAQLAHDASQSQFKIAHMNKRLLQEVQDIKDTIVDQMNKRVKISFADVTPKQNYPVSPEVEQSLLESKKFGFTQDGQGQLESTIAVVRSELANARRKIVKSTPPTLRTTDDPTKATGSHFVPFVESDTPFPIKLYGQAVTLETGLQTVYLIYRRRADASAQWENFTGDADIQELAPDFKDTKGDRFMHSWDIPLAHELPGASVSSPYAGERVIGFVTGSMDGKNYKRTWLTIASHRLLLGDPNPLNFIDAYTQLDLT